MLASLWVSLFARPTGLTTNLSGMERRLGSLFLTRPVSVFGVLALTTAILIRNHRGRESRVKQCSSSERIIFRPCGMYTGEGTVRPRRVSNTKGGQNTVSCCIRVPFSSLEHRGTVGNIGEHVAVLEPHLQHDFD